MCGNLRNCCKYAPAVAKITGCGYPKSTASDVVNHWRGVRGRAIQIKLHGAKGATGRGFRASWLDSNGQRGKELDINDFSCNKDSCVQNHHFPGGAKDLGRKHYARGQYKP